MRACKSDPISTSETVTLLFRSALTNPIEMIKLISAKRWSLPISSKGALLAQLLLGIPTAFDWGKELFGTFQHVRGTRGLEFAILHFKQARWVLVRRLIFQPLSSSDRKVKVDRYGFPMLLPLAVRTELRAQPVSRVLMAYSLFLLSIYSLYKGQVRWRIDTSTITDLPTYDVHVLKEIIPILRDLLARLSVGRIELKDSSFHPTNRSGPNGHALLNAHLDAAALRLHRGEVEGWLEWFTRKTRTSRGFDRFWFTIGSLTHVWHMMANVVPLEFLGTLQLGRVSLKPEHGKFRPFAIVDYFTQAALTPLHKAVMQLLKGIPMDAAFNQDAGSALVREWTRQGTRTLYSFDLTAATDRFPIDFQAIVLDILLEDYGPHLGQCWKGLLVNRAFMLGNRPIHYRTGQPMGALSSWAVFSLCHHLVVQWAASRVYGIRAPTFTAYTLLGDDIVIADSKVAREYLSLMKALGVGINKTKSVVAADSAEFAKRVFFRGAEITGLMWDLFSKASGSSVFLYALVRHLVQRGFTVSLLGLVNAVLGRPSGKRLARPIKSLLLTFFEKGGPLEEIQIWWPLGTKHICADVWSLICFTGIRTEDLSKVREAADGNPVWKAGLFRLQLNGYDLARALSGQLDHIIGSGLKQTWDDFRLRRPHLDVKPLPRDLILQLMRVHPAVKVLADGMNPSVYSDVAQELRVLTRADREELYLFKDVIGHGLARYDGIKHTYESSRDALIFF